MSSNEDDAVEVALSIRELEYILGIMGERDPKLDTMPRDEVEDLYEGLFNAYTYATLNS